MERTAIGDGQVEARETTMSAKWLRMMGVSLALGVPAAARAQTADTDESGRAVVEKWIETRRLISQEKQDWRTGRELLADRARILEKEIAGIREKTATMTNETVEVDRKLAEVRAQNEALDAVAARMRAAVAALETRLPALLARTPDPVRERVKPLVQRLPQNSADTKVSLPERFQSVIGILNEIGKANGEITVATEIRTLTDGRPAEVKALYIGLGQGYYVSAKGEAGTGRPGVAGWEWKPANEIAARITDALQVLQNKASPHFVSLPVKIP